MPITAVYDIGTVTVTNGSPTVTGIGVNWTGAGLREGDMFWSAGLIVRILELVDNTTLTLAHPWPGEDVVGASYEVQYTPDSSRVMGQTTELLATMSQGGIGPLKNLTPANNRFATYSGANTAMMNPITATGKNLVAQNTIAQILALLEISYQTSRYDSAGLKTLRTGSFGLGATNSIPITNLNDQSMPTCFATVQPATAQGDFPPVTSGTDAVIHFRIAGNFSIQIYLSSHGTTPVYIRRSSGVNVWSAWKKLAFE